MPDTQKRVLYVDDDAALGRLVQRRLARHGFAVVHAADAAAGLEALARDAFDVVILDHDLGTSTGLDLLPRIREQAPSLPVIYVTASTELAIAVEALKAGAFDYVVKTVGDDFDALLLSAITQAVEKGVLLRLKEKAEREVAEARDHALVLLAEVNHRVSNSLALVSSLIRMQASASKDPETRAALVTTQARIAAVGDLHRNLYTSDDVRSVDLGAYLTSVLDAVRQSVADTGSAATLTFTPATVLCRTDKAVSVGMIATELVTNALKYAYPDKAGEVRVTLATDADGITLTVADDGVGWRGTGPVRGSGLGSRIIASMAKSLDSQVDYVDVSTGTCARLKVPAAVIERR
jgi:two-component sensor histidine kinase/CheY-like chemotaxis protein